MSIFEALPSATDLSYFLEIAECRSLTRAAVRLGLSQPSLSAALKRLEKAVGATLILRNHDGCRLTRSGQRLVSSSREFLENWEHLRAGVVKEETDLRGRYVIGCHSSVALYSLPHVLPQLIFANPNLQMTIRNSLSRTVVEDVLNSTVDIGIVVNPVRHPDLIIRSLCTDDVSLWTATKPSLQQDFDGADPVFILDPNLFQAQKILQAVQRNGTQKMRILECANLETIVALTAAGTGLGILPGRVAVHNGLGSVQRAQGLSQFKIDDNICLVALADRCQAGAFKSLFRFFEQSLRAAWESQARVVGSSKTSKSAHAAKAQSKKLL